MNDRPPFTRTRVGVVLAALPHVLILAWMALAYADAEDSNRAYVGYLGITELFVMPVALLAALVARFVPPIRGWALPIAGVTIGGGLLVIAVAIVVAGVTGS